MTYRRYNRNNRLKIKISIEKLHYEWKKQLVCILKSNWIILISAQIINMKIFTLQSNSSDAIYFKENKQVSANIVWVESTWLMKIQNYCIETNLSLHLKKDDVDNWKIEIIDNLKSDDLSLKTYIKGIKYLGWKFKY